MQGQGREKLGLPVGQSFPPGAEGAPVELVDQARQGGFHVCQGDDVGAFGRAPYRVCDQLQMRGVAVGDGEDTIKGRHLPRDVLCARGLNERVPGVVRWQGQRDVDDLEEPVGVGYSRRVEHGCGEGQAGGSEGDVGA